MKYCRTCRPRSVCSIIAMCFALDRDGPVLAGPASGVFTNFGVNLLEVITRSELLEIRLGPTREVPLALQIPVKLPEVHSARTVLYDEVEGWGRRIVELHLRHSARVTHRHTDSFILHGELAVRIQQVHRLSLLKLPDAI